MALESEDKGRFIPVRYHELAGALATARIAEADRERFLGVSDALHDVILQEATTFETRLADLYAAFNPDRDTCTRITLDDAARRRQYERLTDDLTYLLAKANFDVISQEEFERALADATSQGLRLTMDDGMVEDIQLFSRGRGTITRTVRSWRTRFRARPVELPVYRRFAVVINLRDDPWVYLKLFKDIPRMDIESLLPHARVRMGLLDRFKLATSGAGALGGSAYKLFQAVGVVAIQWSMILWILLVGAVLLAVRTVSGYRNIRTHRDAMRTRNLYYQNLDNNAGVIHALIAMVCEEEAKEALLAYTFCLTATEPPTDIKTIDRRVEQFLQDKYDVALDFEITDAAETIGRLRLWADREAFTVLDPDSARARLVEHWTHRTTADYHESMADAHRAMP